MFILVLSYFTYATKFCDSPKNGINLNVEHDRDSNRFRPIRTP